MAGTRTIPLTCGAVAIVDADDYNQLTAMGSWYLSDMGYAVRRINHKTIRMHRVVNETPDGLVTDHLNGNRLDNRKSNLRNVTQKQNMQNHHRVKGCSWDAEKQMYMVRFKSKFYGRYKTESDAKQAYRAAKSGVAKPSRIHPRRRYLPHGVYFMLANARKGQAPYYTRPCINGKRTFAGYFDSIADTEAAYIQLTSAKGGLTS